MRVHLPIPIVPGACIVDNPLPLWRVETRTDLTNSAYLSYEMELVSQGKKSEVQSAIETIYNQTVRQAGQCLGRYKIVWGVAFVQ